MLQAHAGHLLIPSEGTGEIIENPEYRDYVTKRAPYCPSAQQLDSVLANVDTLVDRVKPYGDYVLVRRLPDEAEERGIAVPASFRNGRMTPGIRRGYVERVGPGDPAAMYLCESCRKVKYRIIRASWEQNTAPECSDCEAAMSLKSTGLRAPMHVLPGQQVLYDRSPQSELKIGGEYYQMVHEESQIHAVLS